MNDLLKHLNQIHTTELGITRIQRNLGLKSDNVLNWCRQEILSNQADITKHGKNYYVTTPNCVITIHAHSFTIITAHRRNSH